MEITRENFNSLHRSKGKSASSVAISNQYISSEVKFYGAHELAVLLGWGEKNVYKLFNDPEFPAIDYGKSKVVEAHALIDFFSVRREKCNSEYWMGGM